MRVHKPQVPGKPNTARPCPCGHRTHQYLHGEGNVGPCIAKGCGCPALGNVAPPPAVCSCGKSYGKKDTLALHQRLTGHTTLSAEAAALL